MIDPSIGHEEIHDLRRWRRNTAHAADNYDKALDESLARRVCDQDFALPISAFQGALYEEIVGYIGELGKENGPGVYLCMLALVMWFMVQSGVSVPTQRDAGRARNALPHRFS